MSDVDLWNQCFQDTQNGIMADRVAIFNELIDRLHHSPEDQRIVQHARNQFIDERHVHPVITDNI